MTKREFKFDIDLDECRININELAEILKLKTGKDIPRYVLAKVVWCINEDATRAVVLRVGDVKFCLFTSVKNQEIPQDWDWIDERFDTDRLRLLAVSDCKYGCLNLLREVHEAKIKEVMAR